MKEGQYNLALGKFEGCLASLMPMLALEPKGPRRDLLHKQVRIFISDKINCQENSTEVSIYIFSLTRFNIGFFVLKAPSP